MFDNNAETLVNWFENLEETCQNLIFNKSEAWFQNSLDKNDVETAFNSVIRIYKSGKYYLVRTNIKVGANNEASVKIYNENEIPLSIDDVKEDTNIISILEIQGIKFTSRNFQIDIELRQAMVLDNEPLFDNCLIKTHNSNKNINSHEIQKNNTDLANDNKESLEENLSFTSNVDNNSSNNNDNNDNINTIDKIDTKEFEVEMDLGKENEETHEENKEINFDIQELPIEELEDNTELKEMDLCNPLEDDLESVTNETITLKNPNEVYYQLYKEAREKAKLAKRSAIIAYLEAKNIKKTYMIDSLDESESDIDAEIDEVSESELEGL